MSEAQHPRKRSGDTKRQCWHSLGAVCACGDMSEKENLGAVSPSGGRSCRRNMTGPNPFPMPRPRVFWKVPQRSAASKQVPQCCRRSAQAPRSPLPSKAGPQCIESTHAQRNPLPARSRPLQCGGKSAQAPGGLVLCRPGSWSHLAPPTSPSR